MHIRLGAQHAEPCQRMQVAIPTDEGRIVSIRDSLRSREFARVGEMLKTIKDDKLRLATHGRVLLRIERLQQRKGAIAVGYLHSYLFGLT